MAAKIEVVQGATAYHYHVLPSDLARATVSPQLEAIFQYLAGCHSAVTVVNGPFCAVQMTTPIGCPRPRKRPSVDVTCAVWQIALRGVGGDQRKSPPGSRVGGSPLHTESSRMLNWQIAPI